MQDNILDNSQLKLYCSNLEKDFKKLKGLVESKILKASISQKSKKTAIKSEMGIIEEIISKAKIIYDTTGEMVSSLKLELEASSKKMAKVGNPQKKNKENIPSSNILTLSTLATDADYEMLNDQVIDNPANNYQNIDEFIEVTTNFNENEELILAAEFLSPLPKKNIKSSCNTPESPIDPELSMMSLHRSFNGINIQAERNCNIRTPEMTTTTNVNHNIRI